MHIERSQRLKFIGAHFTGLLFRTLHRELHGGEPPADQRKIWLLPALGTIRVKKCTLGLSLEIIEPQEWPRGRKTNRPCKAAIVALQVIVDGMRSAWRQKQVEIAYVRALLSASTSRGHSSRIPHGAYSQKHAQDKEGIHPHDVR